MSPESVPPGEMGTHDHDDELERFFEGLRTAFPARPVAGEDEHVSGMIAQAHLQADKGDPVVRPASNADASAAQVSWLPKQRRNRMTDRKLDKNWNPGLAIKVLAPATVFFTLLGGVAWAGGLPAPLQRTAAHVASLAGVTIDDGTDATEVDTPDATSTDVPGSTTFDQGGDTTDPTSTDNQDGNAQGEDNSSDPTSTDNQDGDSQGEDNSGDTSSTDNQDGDSQGDSSGDSTSGDNNQGDSQDSTSGDGSSQDSQGDSSGSGDTSGDTSGDSGSGSDGSGSGGDGQN